MAQFFPAFPLAGLRGAEYNPRRIDEQALAALRHSLEVVGIAKPIIVMGDLILAGHQRTRSLRALGYETAPAVALKNVTKTDEVRFNQLHNGTDFDSGDEHARVPASTGDPYTYEEVPAAQLQANAKAKKLNIRYEICDLLLLYGNWGACVATMSGEVIHAAQYAMAAQMLGAPIRIYRVPDAAADEVKRLMGQQYGVFSYEHLEKRTYIQTYAQPFRGRAKHSESGCAWQKEVMSRIYQVLVEPDLQPGERLLDFGCGQADYLKHLQKRGVAAQGVEFFFRAGKQIDAAAVHRLIDLTIADMNRHGLFDVVVADSVINSVDTLEAEADVLACLNAFCKPGGRIYFSGRSREYLEEREQRNRIYHKRKTRDVEFLDEHGFSGTFREGEWFYQKFHYQAAAEVLGRRYVGAGCRFTRYEDESIAANAWGVGGTKTVELPEGEVRAAIAREFDLMWPGGRSVDRAAAMLACWDRARNTPPRNASSGT